MLAFIIMKANIDSEMEDNIMMYGGSNFEKIRKSKHNSRDYEFRRNSKLRTKRIKEARKFKEHLLTNEEEANYGEFD